MGLGCMGMSDFYGPADEPPISACSTLRSTSASIFSTPPTCTASAPMRRLLGKVLKTRRKEVVLATKFGHVRGPDGAFLGIDGTPEYVRAACDASLKRLGVDHIDLYYQHRVDPEVRDRGNRRRDGRAGQGRQGAPSGTVGGVGEHHPARRARYIRSRRCRANTRCGRAIWKPTILPACEELGIGVVAYSPLGRGFLTGAFKKLEDFDAGDFRRSNPRFSGENFAGNLQLVEIVSEIAREEGYTPAQVALAWLLDCTPYVVPIPGTRSIKRLKENALAVAVRFEDAQFERLYGILREQPVAGAEYAAAWMATIDA